METKDIPFAPNYFVTSEGKVFSKNYCRRHYCKEILAHLSIGGYSKVNLRVDGETKAFLVHRLVAEAFIPNPKNLTQINHIDFNKRNNYIDNLEWCTPSYNSKYTIEQGRGNKALGEKNGKHKFTREEVVRIRHLYDVERLRQKDIADLFNVQPCAIRGIVKRLIWKHV